MLIEIVELGVSIGDEKGICILPQIFADCKVSVVRGHEAKDLNVQKLDV